MENEITEENRQSLIELETTLIQQATEETDPEKCYQICRKIARIQVLLAHSMPIPTSPIEGWETE